MMTYFGLLIGIFVSVTINQIESLSTLHKEPRGFQFPDGSSPGGDGAPAPGGEQTDLLRQGGPPPGVVSGSLPAGTIPGTVPGSLQSLTGVNQFPAPVAPAPNQFITTGTVVNGACICVPTGRCVGNTTTSVPTDGSGQIDLRIVSNLLTPPPGVTPAVVPAIVTQNTCQAGILERCCQSSTYQCGVRYPPVQGSRPASAGQADFGEYPWQAVLLGPGDVYAGSGALIDNYHVITAAHRVTDYTTSGRALKVRLGEWDASSDTEPLRSQEFTVARIFVHPGYTASNLKNDIAILRLATPVVLGQLPTITTACLPATAFTGARCYVAGWGKNDFSNAGAYQAIQKEVDVPVRSQPECQASLRATRLGAGFAYDTASFMCAGGEIGKDACTGDGGSPLMCELGGRWFVAGLVAWGIGCATGGVPGVYVNVATYVPWIQATVRS